MTDDELREQLALHAVGALSDEERTELHDALRTRPDLRAELADLEAAVTILADAAAVAPPPALRANVLDRIASTPQLAPDTSGDDRPLAPVIPISRRRRHRFIAVGAAAAAIIAIVVGVLVVTPWSSGNDRTAAVLESNDAQTIAMPGTAEAGSRALPGVTIVYSPAHKASVLQADSVPVPQGDRVYELWAIRNGTPERFATFRPDASGRLRVYAAGLDPAGAEQWAITEEPAGGSETPTMPMLNMTAA